MASTKRRIVECSACRRVMKVVTDVETQSETDHLYVMSASGGLLPGLVKVGRSKNPLQRAIDLQDAQPYHMLIHALYWGAGHREKDVHRALAPFQVADAPGTEWFELSVGSACSAISRILFSDVGRTHQKRRVDDPSKVAAAEEPDD